MDAQSLPAGLTIQSLSEVVACLERHEDVCLPTARRPWFPVSISRFQVAKMICNLKLETRNLKLSREIRFTNDEIGAHQEGG